MAQDVKVTVDFKIVENINKNVQEMNKNIKGLSSIKLSGLTNAFSGFKANIIALNQGIELTKKVFGGVVGVVSKFASEAGKIEDLTTQFTTLTGSVENASLLIKDLQTFSSKTPFQIEGLATASRQLLAFGFSQDEVITRLQELGDVAAASGTDLNEVSTIFGQVRAAGKLTGERLLQFQERAIPIGPALAKTMGVAEESIRDLVSQGKVDFDTFQKAFASLSAEGGQFFGGMARQSQTLSGLLSTLSDNFSLLVAAIGERLLPVIKPAIAALTTFIQANKDLIVAGSIKFIGSLVSAFGDLLKIMDKLTPVFFVILNPIELSTNAILRFARSVIKSISSIVTLANRLPGVNISLDGLTSIVETLDGAIDSSEDKLTKAAASMEGFSKFINKAADSTKVLADNITNLKDKKITVTVQRKEEVTTVVKQEESSFIDKMSLALRKGADEFSKNISTTFSKATGGTAAGAAGFGAGLIGQGAAGANQLAGMIGDAIAPGIGQVVQLLAMDTDKFKETINAFFEQLANIPALIAENLPVLIEKLIESIPTLIDSLIEAIPLIIDKLLQMLSSPEFWSKVINAFIKVMLLYFASPIFWLKVAIAVAEAFIRQIPGIAKALGEAIAKAFKDAVKGVTGGVGNLIGGVGKFIGGIGKKIGGFLGLASGIDVPNISKYKNDSFGPVALNAGESVLTDKTTSRLSKFLDAIEGGSVSQSEPKIIRIQIGEKQLAEVMLDLNRRGFRVA